MKRIVVLFLLFLLITGCSSQKEDVKRREIKKQHLSCESTTVDNGVKNNVRININYYNGIISDGRIRLEVIFPENSSIEEKEMLNTLNMCSTDVMTDLIEYGKCTNKVRDNKLTSILTIDKEKIKNYNKSIKEIKEEIENNSNLNCKCRTY
ncbi:MAG: hypothetical protein IKH54_01565 [Bacilli bacterium]|nr:hypothetical protein [Bacilli bacterium]